MTWMKTILIIPVFIMLFSACQKDKAGCFTSTGNQTTVSVQIPAEIDNVTAYGRMRINFIQDSLNVVEIAGGENVVDGIECITESNKLRIIDNNYCNWMRRLDRVPVVTIHYTSLRYFGSENYYDNLFLKQHHGDSIMMEYWTGSGKTKFYGNVDRAYFKVNAGAGGYECNGKTNYLYVYNYGGAKINCSGMSAIDVFAVTGSNNDVMVNYTYNLVAEIRRTGNVIYTGNPSLVKRIGNGSGELINGE